MNINIPEQILNFKKLVNDGSKYCLTCKTIINDEEHIDHIIDHDIDFIMSNLPSDFKLKYDTKILLIDMHKKTPDNKNNS